MDMEGFEPSPVTLMGYRAAVTPQAHERELKSGQTKVVANSLHWPDKSFFLGQRCRVPHFLHRQTETVRQVHPA